MIGHYIVLWSHDLSHLVEKSFGCGCICTLCWMITGLDYGSICFIQDHSQNISTKTVIYALINWGAEGW